METEIVMGRESCPANGKTTAGCGLLGRTVSYPNGRYEETGELFLDLASPHCTLIVGKRGTGKSHTMGVLAEGFAMLERPIRERTSVVILDTLGVFGGLGAPAPGAGERNPLCGKVRTVRAGEAGMRGFRLPWRGAGASDWLRLFDLSPLEPSGALLCKVWSSLSESGAPFGIEEIRSAIRGLDAPEHLRSGLEFLFASIHETGIMDSDGTSIDVLLEPGAVTVLDLSGLSAAGAWDPRDLLCAMVVRSVQSSRAEDGARDRLPLVCMMIDEAHIFYPSSRESLSRTALTDWIKLGRSQGLASVLATQEPSAIHPTAVSQADLIISHYLTSRDDLESLARARGTIRAGDKAVHEWAACMERRRGLAAVFDDRSSSVELCQVRPRLTRHDGADSTAMGGGRWKPAPMDSAIVWEGAAPSVQAAPEFDFILYSETVRFLDDPAVF